MTDSKKLLTEAKKRLKTVKAEKKQSFTLHKREVLLHELDVHRIELELQNEELRNALLEIEKSQNKYFELYEFLPISVITVDEKGVINEANFTAGETFNITRGPLVVRNIVGRNIRLFITTDDLSCFEDFFAKTLKSEIKQSITLRMVTREGNLIYAQIAAKLLKSQDNKRQVLIAIVDVTERKQVEEILKRDKFNLERLVKERSDKVIQMQAELENARRLSDIGMLAATVAHELRNPLAAINMAVTNVRRKTKNSKIENHLVNIETKIFESDRVIKNLLFYSRIKPPHMDNVSLYDIIKECIDVVRKQYKKQVFLTTDLNSIKSVLLKADSFQLKEVFCNILNNAYDAVSDKKGRIEIKSKDEPEFISIKVFDNGQGINKDDIGKVFEPFFTTKAKGTGLGLTICRQIIKMHNGSIQIESEKGKNTSVFVKLLKKTALR